MIARDPITVKAQTSFCEKPNRRAMSWTLRSYPAKERAAKPITISEMSRVFLIILFLFGWLKLLNTEHTEQPRKPDNRKDNFDFHVTFDPPDVVFIVAVCIRQ